MLAQLPIHIALRRSLADKSNLIPAGTPPDSPYVLLPDFITVSGTLGAPKVDFNKTVLAGLLAKSTLGLPGTAGNEVGNLIEGLGRILNGDLNNGTNNVPNKKRPPNPLLNLLRLPGEVIQKTGETIQDGSGLIGGQKREKEPKKKD